MRTYNDELDAGIAEFETALRLNPNHADAWMWFADLKVFEGKGVEALDCIRNAFRLNPHPRGAYYWMLGFVQYAAQGYDDAVKTLRLEAANGTGGKLVLAAALAQLGRMDEASEEARQYLAAIPNFSARKWGRTQAFRNDADRQHFVEGYLKAGLPA